MYAGKINPDEVVLFLDCGAKKTALSIISNCELISTRAIITTGDSLTKEMSRYFSVPGEGAEVLKKTFGISALVKPGKQQSGATEKDQEASLSILDSADKSQQAKNAMLPLLEHLVEDIEHTFKYFSYHIAQSHVTSFDKVVISGGSSYLKGLIPFLRNRLNVEVESADSLLSFRPLEEYLGQPDQEMLQRYGVRNMQELAGAVNVALGLALRALE
jgi:Tfp pilus assembly PilM family ATPase